MLRIPRIQDHCRHALHAHPQHPYGLGTSAGGGPGRSLDSQSHHPHALLFLPGQDRTLRNRRAWRMEALPHRHGRRQVLSARPDRKSAGRFLLGGIRLTRRPSPGCGQRHTAAPLMGTGTSDEELLQFVQKAGVHRSPRKWSTGWTRKDRWTIPGGNRGGKLCWTWPAWSLKQWRTAKQTSRGNIPAVLIDKIMAVASPGGS